jgi:hypothetical protein
MSCSVEKCTPRVAPMAGGFEHVTGRHANRRRAELVRRVENRLLAEGLLEDLAQVLGVNPPGHRRIEPVSVHLVLALEHEQQRAAVVVLRGEAFEGHELVRVHTDDARRHRKSSSSTSDPPGPALDRSRHVDHEVSRFGLSAPGEPSPPPLRPRRGEHLTALSYTAPA